MICKICGKIDANTGVCVFCGTQNKRADKIFVKPITACPECGAQYTGRVQFCSACGAAVPDGMAAVAPYKPKQYAAEQNAPDPQVIAAKRKAKNTRIGITSIVFAVIALAIAAVGLTLFIADGLSEGVMMLVGAGMAFVISMIMAIVALVRAKKNKYKKAYGISSLSLNGAAAVISAVVLVLFFNPVMLAPNWQINALSQFECEYSYSDGNQDYDHNTETHYGSLGKWRITGIKDKNVKELEIPSFVSYIYDGALKGCDKLEKLIIYNTNNSPYHLFGVQYGGKIPENLTVEIKQKKISYFFDDVKNIYIGAYTEEITSDAFKYCDTVESIIVDKNNPNYSSQNGILYNKARTRIVYVPKSIKSVELPSGITSIESNTFSGCVDLNEITIPNSVTDISQYAFSDCENITAVTLPASALKYVPKSKLQTVIINGGNRIGNSAFSDCEYLTSITMPDSLTSIGDSAFKGCGSLTNITIPSSVTSIGAGAFRSCKSLKSITIPSSVTSIEGYTFYNCADLTSITFAENSQLTGIGESAFQDCSSLSSITIPNGVTSVGYSAFKGCSSLIHITIPESLTSIKSGAFYDCFSLTIYCEATSQPRGWDRDWNRYNYSSRCSVVWDCKNNNKDEYGYVYSVIDGIRYSLKDGLATVIRQPSNISGSITIPNSVNYKNETYSVSSIDDGAFYECSKLTSIMIPNSVTSIGHEAFKGCDNLQYNKYDKGLYLGNTDNKYFVMIKVTDKTITSCSIHNDTKIICDNAFKDCSSLNNIIIPNGVVSIGQGAFNGCSSLESMTIPFVGMDIHISNDSVIHYPFGYIFGTAYYTTGIKIEQFSYSNDSSSSRGIINYYVPSLLKNVTVTGGNILDGAFYNCSGLSSIAIPNSVTSIGRDAFYGCSSLSSITIPNSVTSIDNFAFYGCSGLSSITIPNSVTSIDNFAFYGCSGLSSISVEKGNTKYHSINNCIIETASNTLIAGCKNSVIPTDGSVKSIGNGAFGGRSSLIDITIPNSVTNIGNSAFNGCSSLSSITIPGSVMNIGWGAFKDCNSLTIYCEATQKPSGWDRDWNSSNCPVVWGHKNNA